jgi:hypothetical protein
MFRFWDDMWCGLLPLKQAFPVLYGIACDKDAFVAAYLDFSSDSLQWDVSFSRVAHDWELDVVASFFSLLYSLRVRRAGEDKLRWNHSFKGKFDVRSFYRFLLVMLVGHFLGRVFGGPRLL